MGKAGLLFLLLFIFSLIAYPLCKENFESDYDIPYTEAFHRTYGWAGADGTYSLPLSSGKTVWLFSDTLIGEVNPSGARSEDTIMINNSIALQDGPDPSTVKFLWGGTEEKGESLFIPPDGTGWFWLCDGLSHPGEDRITLLLGQFDIKEEDGTFGFNFKHIGTWIADFYFEGDRVVVENYEKLPYFKTTPEAVQSFGSCIMEDGEWTYIYGTEDYTSRKTLIVARVPAGKIRDTASWEFYGKDGWSKNFDDITPVFDGVCNELSVHKTEDGKYILTTQDAGIGDVILLTADSPEGPWGDKMPVWKIPENTDTVISYNAKAHPELSNEEEGLLISYNVNTLSQEELLGDGGVYRPRFIRVKFNASGE